MHGPGRGPLGKETTMKKSTVTAAGRQILRRLNDYTLWAFNPQAELTSRYTRD